MVNAKNFPAEGGCACGSVRYRMESAPLFVHCCHCRWCQRESGASFALNALIETDRVTNLRTEPELVQTPSESGAGQVIARCPTCRVALWSNYAGAGPAIKFVRVGTLDNPDLVTSLILIGAVGVQENKERLKELNLPCLAVWGGEDTISPLTNGRLIQQEVKSAELVIIPGAPHPCYLDQPNEWHRILLRFLTEKLPA